MTGTDKGYPCPWLSLTKEGLEMMGIHVGVARKPMLPLPEDVRQRLAKVLKEYGKIYFVGKILKVMKSRR
jgi:dihydrodipicolinate synthase/N-acetylneuraminate lyase